MHRAALFGVLFARGRGGRDRDRDRDRAGDRRYGGQRRRLVTADGRRLGGFDLVVDATGARSKLRRLASNPSEPKPLAYGAFWASLGWRGEGFDAHALLQRYHRASVMIGVLPIGRPQPGAEQMAAFFWSLKPDEADAVRAAGLAAWKERVAGLWPECDAYLAQIDSFDQLALARYGHHTLAHPVGRSLAIIGDAAHSTSPQLGQGANMALLDARALAHALAVAADGRSSAAGLCQNAAHACAGVPGAVLSPSRRSTSRTRPCCRSSATGWSRRSRRIPPAPQLLASMVAGTVVDPFGPIGLKEVDWSSMQAAFQHSA